MFGSDPSRFIARRRFGVAAPERADASFAAPITNPTFPGPVTYASTVPFYAAALISSARSSMSSAATHARAASRPGSRGGFTAPLVATAALLVCCYAFSPNFQYAGGDDATPFAGDFLQEWIGGYIVLQGDRARFYDPAYAQSLEHDPHVVPLRWDPSRYLPIVYPPFYYLLLSPLALLPLKTAAWLWAVLLIAALAATAWLLRRAIVRQRGVFALWIETSPNENGDNASANRRARWPALAPWAIVAAVAFVPVIENFTSSQKGTVCLLILTATFLLLDSRRPFAAGLVFGLIAFKPQLALPIAIAMLLARQWRFVAGGAATGAALVGLCFVLGTDVCRQYFHFATGAADYMQNAGYDLHKSHCLFGFFTLLAGEPNAWVKGATLLSAAGVVLLLALVLRGGIEAGTRRFALQYCSLVLATLLLSPHLFTYDLTVLLLPLTLLAFLLAAGCAATAAMRLIGWLVVLLYGLAGVSPLLAERCGVQVTVPLMVSLLAALAWEARAGACRDARSLRNSSFAHAATNG